MYFQRLTPSKWKLLFGELPSFFLTSGYLASQCLDPISVPKSEGFESMCIP